MPSTIESLQLALAHQQGGRFAEAERIYREVLARDPDHPDALHLLGVLASQTGRHPTAAAYIARAIALNPAAPFYHNNLGNVLQDLGRFSESLLCYEEALRLEPDYVEARINLGNALNKLGRFPEALGCYLEAQKLRPDYPGAYINLGHALKDQGLLHDALGCFEEALRLDPQNAEAHSARALAWLLTGDFQRGWAEYEWRWKVPTFPPRPFPQPPWDGSPLDGRRILLYAEQGLGDTIQFVRYAPLVKQRGGTVLVECQPALVPLIRTMDAIDQVIPGGTALPEFDLHAPLMSLPRIFGTTLATVPSEVPYFQAPAREWVPADGPEGVRRVGIAWAGRPTHKNDRNRSLSLADLAPLARVAGIALVSLHRRAHAGDALCPSGLILHDLPEEFSDIPGTASLIQALDLVISVDTMAAHLAGALAKPVWVLLPFAPDWRWMLDREDSPWYPTARLFRQPEPGDWQSVLERVARELEALCSDVHRT